MKHLKRMMVVAVVCLAFSWVRVGADSSITGKNLDVNVTVMENGTLKVTESQDVFFNGSNQGIYIDIAQKYNMDFGDGEETIYMPVRNFQILTDDNVEYKSTREYVRAIVGTPGVFLHGAKNYKYAYEIQMQDLGLKDDNGVPFDLFYQNIVSENWQWGFENVSFRITMPKPITTEVFAYVGRDKTPVNFKVEGNTITGSFSNLHAAQGLSVETKLEDGYFNYPSNDFTMIPAILLVLVVIASYGLYSKYGKEYPVVETVSFKGPEGFSSGEVGYVYRGHSISEDIVSLIVYWASHGYLTLKELDESGSNIEISKVKDLESENEVERSIFKELFLKGDVTTTKALTNQFGQTVQYGITHLADRFRRSSDLKMFDATSSAIKWLMFVVIIGLVGLYGAMVGYKIFPVTSSLMLGGGIGLAVAIFTTIVGMLAFSRDGINVRKQGFVSASLYTLVYTAIAGFVYLMIAISRINTISYLVVAISLLVGMYPLANMSRRTMIGSQKYGEILGLERFIRTAEVERLKMFAEETPTLFYDLLPYAYALKITDVWMHKFKTIAIQQPDWYQTHNPGSLYTDFYIMNALNNTMSSVNSAMTAIPSGKAGSGGGNFGGGSFGGGGGFGGGGFGGSGGGGW